MIINEKYSTLINQSEADFNHYQSLPLPVYVTAFDGTLLNMNQEAIYFFGLTKSGFSGKNISKFYKSKDDRRRIIAKMEHLEHESWDNNETIIFRIHNEYKSVRFLVKPYKASDRLIGTLCIAIEISAMERFKELESLMPLGVFEIDPDRMITYANPKFLEILGYTLSDIGNIPIDNILRNTGELNGLIEELSNGKIIENRAISLRSKQKSLIQGIVSIVPMLSTNSNKLWGSKGVLKDATFDEILEKLPIPLYMVSNGYDGEEMIIAANDAFAKFNEVDNVELCKVKIKQYWPDTDRLIHLQKAMHQKFEKGEPLLSYNTILTNVKGHEKNVILNLSPIGIGENVIGRVGAIIDISEDVDRAVIDIRQDFGSFLHTYSNVMNTLRSTLLWTIQSHGIGVLDKNGKIGIEETLKKIEGHAKGLKSKIDNFSKNEGARIFEENNLNIFYNEIEKIIENIKVKSGDKMKVTWVRTTAIKLRSELMKFKESPFPREWYKNLLFDLTEILRFSSMISMSLGLEEIRKMSVEIDTFRETLFPIDGSFTPVKIKALIGDVLSSLTEESANRNVEIRLFDLSDKLTVIGFKNNLHVAFKNVIHNAIKYSWTKSGDLNSFVEIRFIDLKKDLRIEIENRGVPIRVDELPKLVFNYGFRGAESGERERTGSGVGLWHARKIIKEHGGDITITSKPIFGKAETDYSAPFLTTVCIILPIVN